MDPKRILVVDDEETLCEVLKINLQNEGYKVDVATSAEQALTYDIKQYALILLDIMMSEISGIQMAKILKAEPATASIPIIFCTARDLSIEDLLKSISILEKYTLLKTTYLEKLYLTIKKSISKLLKEDAISTFTILNWLEKIANTVGDKEARESFSGIICRTLADNVYRRPQSKSTISLWNAVIRSSFADDAICYLLYENTVNEYNGTLQGYVSLDWISFTDYISKSLSKYSETPSTLKSILTLCLNKLYRAKDGKTAIKILSLFATKDFGFVKDMILSEAANTNNSQYVSFLLQTLVKASPQIVSTNERIISVYKELAKYNLQDYITIATEYKARNTKTIKEAEEYLVWIKSIKSFDSLDISGVLLAIDNLIDIGDYSVGRISNMIQESKPKSLSCVNSAHVCAIQLFENKKIVSQLIQYLTPYSNQGFPSVENDRYASILMDKLFNCKFPEDVFEGLIVLISKSEYYSNRLIIEGLKHLGNRKGCLVGLIVDTAAQIKSANIYNALVKECSELKPFEKSMRNIRDEINTRNGLQFFAQIERDSVSVIEQRKEPSLFGRFFSKGGNNSDNNKRKK